MVLALGNDIYNKVYFSILDVIIGKIIQEGELWYFS